MNRLFKLIVLTLPLLVLLSCGDGGVVPGDTKTFVKFFGGPFENEAFDIKETSDGYIIAGRRQGINSNGDADDYDFYVIKTDRFGNEEWTVTIGDSLNDEAKSVIQTNDGNFVACGTITPTSDSSRIYITKISTDGTVLWENFVGSANPIYSANYISECDNGDLVIAGYSRANTSAVKNGEVFRVDPTGSIQIGNYPFGDALYDDEAFQVYQKFGVVETGESYEFVVAATIGSADVILSNGGDQLGAILLLGENLGGKDAVGIGSPSGLTNGYSAIHTNDSTYYLVGSSNALSPSLGGFDAYLTKFTRNQVGFSDTLWTAKYGIAGQDVANHIIDIGDGFVIGGQRGPESMLIKTDYDGRVHIVDCDGSQSDITHKDFCHLNATRLTSNEDYWFKTFGSIAQQMEGSVNSVARTSEGGYITVGISRFASTTMIAVTKTNDRGELGN